MCVITAPCAAPQIIPLQEVTNEWLHGAAKVLRLVIRKSRNRFDDRGVRKTPVDGAVSQHSGEYNILADIWCRIVQPLLGVLGWKVS
jgi:hypothetical protein